MGKNGDTYDRYLVRMEEMRQSNRILAQCLDKIREPAGRHQGEDLPRDAAAGGRGLPLDRVAERGARLLHRRATATPNPYRCHVRPPSFVNLQALPEMAKGHLVSDLVALIGTIDIVLGEVDR